MMAPLASPSPGGRAGYAALRTIAEYTAHNAAPSAGAVDAAYHCLLGALGSGFDALRQPACARLLGPVVPGATMAHGARVPGTSYELDPVMGAFNIAAMMRWVGDEGAAEPVAWPAGPQRVPAQHLGAILALGDYLARRAHCEGRAALVIHDLLIALIKAHEIQDMLAGANAHEDQAPFALAASAAVSAHLLGARSDQIIVAVADAWRDGGGSVRPGPARDGPVRSAVACGDLAGRAVRLALVALLLDTDQPSASAACTWEMLDPAPLGRRFLQSAGCRSASADPVAAFEASVAAHFGARQAAKIQSRFSDAARMLDLPVNDCVALLVRNG